MQESQKILTINFADFLKDGFHFQSISVIFCFIISYFFYRIIRKFFFPRIIAFSLRKNIEFNRFIVKYFIPMAFIIFTNLFLIIALFTAPFFIKDITLLLITFKLVVLFTFLRFMRISANSTFMANFIGFFLILSLILDVFGVLNYVIGFLDSIALNLGKIRISLYITIKSIIVLMIVFWLSSLVTKKSKSYIDASKKIKTSNKIIAGKFIDIFVYCVITVVILKTVGVEMTTFAVIGGAIGVGIGFGLQKIASNFISGIILLFEKSIEVGDWVEIDNGNILGIVKHFGGRYTLIECFDGKEIMVPNEDFIINRVNNWTYSNNRARIEIYFSVAYGTDLQKAIDVATQVAKEHPRCLNYPEIECYVERFAEYDVKMMLFFWVSDITKGRLSAKSLAYVELQKKFKENNIEIPVPRRDIFMRDSNQTF